MRFVKALAKAAGLAAFALAAARPSSAASTATLNIDVTIAASLSVSVSAAASSTMTAAWTTPNQILASGATAAIRNDSGGLTEKWALSTLSKTINTAGNPANWNILASTAAPMGEDQTAVQAVLGSSNTAACPAAGSNDWNQAYAPPLTTTTQIYGDDSSGPALFAANSGDTILNAGGGTPLPDKPATRRMLAGSSRALCWRVLAPASSSAVDTQNVQIVVTAVAP